MAELVDILSRADVKTYIKEHVNADVNKLLLNPPTQYKSHIKEIVAQILARQKAKGKLDNWAQNFDLVLPPPISIEQASSQATAEYKGQLVAGDRLIDLTGGMGVDFLALSKAFKESTYVEKEPAVFRAFAHNAKALGSSSKVVNEDAEAFLAQQNEQTKSIIFLDPARRDANKSKVFRIEDCSPNLLKLLPELKRKADQVLVKYSPLLDIHAILQSIQGVKEIHVVSIRNECKELLILIDFSFTGASRVVCVNLESCQEPYTFQMDEERSAPVGLGELDKFVMEPNSSILKAGAFKKIASDFQLNKLASNTHLYTSGSSSVNFPGRVFRVVEKASKETIKAFAPDGKINVITRNYPLSSNELKKKWKLKDGGDHFLIGFKNRDNKAELIIADRVDPSK